MRYAVPGDRMDVSNDLAAYGCNLDLLGNEMIIKIGFLLGFVPTPYLGNVDLQHGCIQLV